MTNTLRPLEQFLSEIDFDGRVSSPEGISNDELRQIVLDRLVAYQCSEVDTDFILDLASTLYEVAVAQLQADEDLIGILCDMTTFQTELDKMVDVVSKKLTRG